MPAGRRWQTTTGTALLDLAVLNHQGGLVLFRNTTAGAGNWLHVRLSGRFSNRDAIGAVVRVAAGGTDLLMRQVIGGYSTHSQDELVLHFGLGVAAVADTVEVLWPGGLVNVHRRVAANQLFEVAERAVSLGGLFDPSRDRFFLRDEHSDGPADRSFEVQQPGGDRTPLTADWDGDGIATVGLFERDTGEFLLWNTHAGGVADVTFAVNIPAGGWLPIAGDWDGDGAIGVGLFDPGRSQFLLWNDLDGGDAEVVFSIGFGGGSMPLAGDWDGDGVWSVGLYNPASGRFHLSNVNADGPGFGFRFGPVGAEDATPLGGDWDGDGIDTVGLHRTGGGQFLLRNSNDSGAPDVAFTFGPPAAGWTPLAGAWHTGIVE